jgi:cytidylate kinase
VGQADDLKQFLDAVFKVERGKPVRRGTSRALPFVTISREAGAGGSTLAQTLVKMMESEGETGLFRGWQVLDRTLCEILLQDADLDVSMRSLLAEEYRSQIHEFVLGLFGQRSDQYLVMKKMFEAIRSFATVGKVIIVGRGGSQVARKLELGVHVRLVAPEVSRVQRMRQLLNQNEEETKRIIHKQDQDRARLLKSHFQADIADPLLYDVVCNTGTVSFEAISESIISMIRHRAKEHSPGRTR